MKKTLTSGARVRTMELLIYVPKICSGALKLIVGVSLMVLSPKIINTFQSDGLSHTYLLNKYRIVNFVF